MAIYENAYDLIGKTPILKLNDRITECKLQANLFVKLESFNPTGSIKDRPAYNMIIRAKEQGVLKAGGVIIEPTSGNTGIALASIGAQMGYRVILVMPDSMSEERIKIIKAYGAEIVLTKGALGMQGAVDEAERLLKEIENSFMPSQFDNYANVESHIDSTAKEVFDDFNGNIDIVVAGIGTGGTSGGIALGLKKRKEKVKIVGVEPQSSPVITCGKAGKHKIQGIGANFVPKCYLADKVDEVRLCSDIDAMSASRKFSKTQGVLVGISSGASISVAIELAKLEENKGKNILAICPDGGEKYLSTELYEI